MEQEQERLQRLYAEMSDERLRTLSADDDSLTDTARFALRKVMVERGLVARKEPDGDQGSYATPAHEHEQGFAAGIPGVFPSSAATVEQALDPGGAVRAGMVNLVTFFDGHELTQACEALDGDGVDFAIENVEGDALTGAPASFTLWVDPLDKTAAEQVLRVKLGLFPVREALSEEEENYDEEQMTLGSFETEAEAERVRGLLTDAGIQSQRSNEEIDGAMWHDVTVKGTDLERGLQVVSAGLHIN